MTTSHRRRSLVQREEGRPLSVQDIQWNHEQRLVTIGDTTVILTATEYSLLIPLKSGRPVSYEDLANQAYSHKVDEKVRMMMDKHIDRVRFKLRGSGIYVYCILNYGYILMIEYEGHDRLSKYWGEKDGTQQ